MNSGRPERPSPEFFVPVHAGSLALLLLAGALQGCQRGADSGATANPNAPGRPGTGNEVVTIAPQPESLPESPQLGGQRWRIPEGVTGRGGTPDYPGEVQDRSYPWMRQQPGVGLDGGLEPAPGSVQSGTPSAGGTVAAASSPDSPEAQGGAK